MNGLKFTELETRTCGRCGKEFEHFDMIIKRARIDEDEVIEAVTENVPLSEKDGDKNVYCDPCIHILNHELESQLEEKRKIRVASEKWESIVPAEYRDTSVKHPRYSLTMHEAGRKWVRGVKVADGGSRLFLGLVGASGITKTRVMARMTKILIWEERDIFWASHSKFEEAAQNEFGDSAKASKAFLDRCFSARYLAFDDIGALRTTEAIANKLHKMLEFRTSEKLPMIWTSNETIDEMLIGDKITPKARMRTVSRLAGYSEIIEI